MNVFSFVIIYFQDLLNIKTNTGAALKEAYDMFKSQGRSDAVQIMTLITNGTVLVFNYTRVNYYFTF